MKSNNTRIFQCILIALALFFIATDDWLMALSMSLLVVGLEPSTRKQCDEKRKNGV